MKFLVRFCQMHESFRKAELEALAEVNGIDLKILDYQADTPFCIVEIPTCAAAKLLIQRAILIKAIYELWACAPDYEQLHAQVKSETSSQWDLYMTCSFKFMVDTFQGTRTMAEQVSLIEAFRYMAFRGPLSMKKPDVEFCIFEEYEERAPTPRRVLFGKLLGTGAREDVSRYTLKKRKYISTTSMDAELALIGSNLALARPGSLFYDPFVGTASLTLACSHHGAVTLGSDMDGRAIRGKKENNVRTSYAQYGLQGRYLNGFVSDLTNTPLRLQAFPEHRPLFDGIVCDPPYGVREGLKVLGSSKPDDRSVKYLADGRIAHLAPGYLPPKRPYSFEAMLADILDFAAQTLVVNGRLSFWMPVANDEYVELGIPMHAALALVSNCVQPFNKWSRRLLTYRRRRPSEIVDEPTGKSVLKTAGHTADELNSFRKRYFQGFQTAEEADKRAEQG